MKKKIKVIVPEYLIEILESDKEHFSITKERLCNNILFVFSLKFKSDYKEELTFENKKYLQFTIHKGNRPYYYEVLQSRSDASESEILRKIFLSYAMLPPFLRESYLFKEKVSFLKMALKDQKRVKINTREGVLEGVIEDMFRDKETGYLKIKLCEKSYFISKVVIA